jgi:hypothetical protein
MTDYKLCIDLYIQAIRYNLMMGNPNEWEFKSNPNYTGVLEHVKPIHGMEYLGKISTIYNSFFNAKREFLIDLCYKNDKFGKTVKHNYENFAVCSPTNLRYIFQSLLIIDYIKSEMLNNMNIIEIGGGYGGLAFYLKHIAPLFGVKITSYTMFDLPEACELQKRYLLEHGMDVQTANIHDMNSVKLMKNSFLISNYAFTEIDMWLQNKYTTEVLNPYTSHGFLTWNIIPIYEFVQGKIISFECEFPLTSTFNYYVTYRPCGK